MQTLDKILDIEYPVILAPMFLVTTSEMVKIALDNGISGAIPAMNFRKDGDLAKTINEIKQYSSKSFGVNLITNHSNLKYKQQLKEILDSGPAYIISSLGNPQELIKEAHKVGIKVFCDVVDLKYAKKTEDLGADALIAVNSSAGGHCGIHSAEELIEVLTKNCNIPIINAGGVSSHKDLTKLMSLGAAGASVGTVFIASVESPVSAEYKEALVRYGKDDIVLTKKLSGANTTVINTDYVKKIGTKPNFLEKLINKNTFLKKTAKSMITKMGMNKLEKAAFKATYKTFWCAGISIESIKEIRPLKEIIKEITIEKQ
ncbi:MAG TPA: nitronate monooxygenase [Bacteroidales bacterium]|nr:nitronate monooxygenase [Bacteroidales bacterium]